MLIRQKKKKKGTRSTWLANLEERACLSRDTNDLSGRYLGTIGDDGDGGEEREERQRASESGVVCGGGRGAE